MGFVFTRNIEELERLEGIGGSKIPAEDVKYLTQFAQTNGVLCLEVPSQTSDFSKPKYFFINNKTKFVFLKNGKVVPFSTVDADNQNFTAFCIRKQHLYVYGYFADDYD